MTDKTPKEKLVAWAARQTADDREYLCYVAEAAEIGARKRACHDDLNHLRILLQGIRAEHNAQAAIAADEARCQMVDPETQLVTGAPRGDLNENQRRIAETGIRILATLLRKNADYGSTVFDPPALAPEMDPGSAILVRMSDKIGRIANLVGREDRASVDESLDDTLADLAGYAILYLARPQEPTTEDGHDS